jgi:hypothetical protein
MGCGEASTVLEKDRKTIAKIRNGGKNTIGTSCSKIGKIALLRI